MKITNWYIKSSVIFGCLLAGCAIGILSTIIGSNSVNIIPLSFTLSIFPPLALIIFSFLKNKGIIDLSNPLFLYSLFYCIFFGFGGIIYKGDYQDNVEIGGIATIIGIIGYMVGYFFSSIFQEKVSYDENIAKRTTMLFRSVQFEKILFFVGMVGYIFYILRIGNIPVFMNDLEQARVDASVKGGANLRILASFLILSATIGFLNISLYKVHNNKALNSSRLRYILSIIFLLLLGNRSPVYNILFTSFLIFIMCKYQGKFKLSKLIPVSVIGILAVISFVGGIGAYRVVNTESFSSYPEFKIFLSNGDYIGLSLYVFTHYLSIGFENFMRVLEVVPNILDYKLGKSYIEPLLTVLPGTQYTLDMQIKMSLNQGYFGGGTVPSVMGEAFANFGYFGWFFIPFFSMLLLRIVYFKFTNNHKNMFLILIYAFLLNHFSNSLLSGLASSSIMPFITLIVYICYGKYIGINKHSRKVFTHES
ncbi:oligosaccharide repeat unit polymerase [Neobacillus sp. B4I6]|uniref:O-antigen polymerase n=1 Tax=Neobacillus sp. B4I6 TaxID=3373925 RepID=UPI003D213B2C